MKRKLGPVAFILETARAYQRIRNTISSLCLEGTPVYHKRSKKGYCVLAGIPRIGGTFDLHLYRYDTGKKGEEVKSLYNITPEQFDLYGCQYVELASAKSPTISFSKLPVPGRKVDPEGRSRFACTRLKEWSNPWPEFKCYPQEICWMHLDGSKDPDDDTEVSAGYPWNAASRHPRYPFQRMKWSTFVIQYRIFYEFHDLIDGPRPTCEYPVNE